MDEYARRYSAAVADELRAERAASRLTIDELAEKAGMVRATVMRYLNGQREVRVPELLSMCRAMGVRPGDILDRASLRAEREHD